MWDSLNTDSCDICHFSRKKPQAAALPRADDHFLEKEHGSPMKGEGEGEGEEVSLYEAGARGGPRPPPSPCGRPPSRRHPDFHDSSSQDSGYALSCQGDGGKFSSYASPTRSSSLSFGSGSICSMEEDFLEDFSDVEPLEKAGAGAGALPEDFGKLLTNPLIGKARRSSPKDAVIRPLFRRALSLHNARVTPVSSKVRTSLFRGEACAEGRSFKRPDPPSELESALVKRSRMFDDEADADADADAEASVPVARPTLQRAFSATEESIMCAVQRSSAEPDLIGDFSRNFCLPLTRSKHQDLKAIAPGTLARLMRGEFRDVASFRVIDCRYPYEFDGGHIDGAVNIYTKEQCLELLEESQMCLQDGGKRHLLIFHCEFSSERGPNLYRYLRKEDRQRNESAYPCLNFPEIYLLEGGYKSFFLQFSEMCVPVAYKEMLHPDHEDDLRHFRQKSKTWNADSRSRQQYKSLKRL